MKASEKAKLGYAKLRRGLFSLIRELRNVLSWCRDRLANHFLTRKSFCCGLMCRFMHYNDILLRGNTTRLFVSSQQQNLNWVEFWKTLRSKMSRNIMLVCGLHKTRPGGDQTDDIIARRSAGFRFILANIHSFSHSGV